MPAIRGKPGCRRWYDGGNVSRPSIIAVIATSITLTLGAGVATAADTVAQAAPSAPKTIWQTCAPAGQPERDRCMLNVPAKDSTAGRQCEEDMSRAQRKCMLDFLEASRR